MHLANPSHNIDNDPFVTRPEGRMCTPLRTGPASYVEALRVARALWRLQYYDAHTSHPADDMRK